MRKKLIILLLLSSCSFRQIPRKEIDLSKSIIGWWERYYPYELSRKPTHLTHIEFFDYGEFRYTTGAYLGDHYSEHTSSGNKWIMDSTNPSNILFASRYGSTFLISILDVNKTNLIMKLTYPDFIDTVYMKKTP